jgi:HSP20 family protein
MRTRDWQALRELLALRARFQQFFELALIPPTLPALSADAAYEPPVDAWEDADRIVVEVELPGVPGDDIEVRLEDRSLLIAGSTPARDEPGSVYLRIERPRGRFARRVSLPAAVHGSPEATLTGGVLTVVLRKSTSSRRIPVEAGGGGS